MNPKDFAKLTTEEKEAYRQRSQWAPIARLEDKLLKAYCKAGLHHQMALEDCEKEKRIRELEQMLIDHGVGVERSRWMQGPLFVGFRDRLLSLFQNDKGEQDAREDQEQQGS